ncbi:MAG: hypothetical protein L6R37_008477 [Teloschistes peruensis]|nr:MAG: hypothetical protein L6R37_008477 [Teloschistes peruensis]
MYDETVELPEWLTKVLAFDGKEWDDFNYRQGRNVLIRYNLLQRTQGDWGGVRMHGLVQWRAIKFEQAMPWDRWHLMATTAACTQLSKNPASPEFRRHMVTYIPDLSRKCLTRLGIDETRMPFVWGTVVNTYFDEGRWKEAEELQVQVMETRTRVLGEEHPDTLTSMANLASTYWNQGRWKEAEELNVQVIETRTRVLGEEHPDTLTSMANMASTYWKQGRWKEAEELKVHVIETRTRVHGDEQPDTLPSMANMAYTWTSQSRNEEAISMMEKCFELQRHSLGPDHPHTVSSREALNEWQRGNNKIQL